MSSRRRHLTIGLAGIVVAVALTQVVSLMGARLEQGDVFAEYSTMRADPLGMMAVYNALDALPQYETLQYVRPFEELPEGKETTLVIAGAGLGMDPKPILESLEHFVSTGGRAVITFSPLEDDFALDMLRRSMRARDRALARKAGKGEDETQEAKDDEGETAEEDTAEIASGTDEGEEAPESDEDTDSTAAGETTGNTSKAEDNNASKSEEDTERFPLSPADLKSQDISERWDFDYGFELPLRGTVASRTDAALPVETNQRLFSGLYFESDSGDWTNVYIRPGGNADAPERATVMERSFGAGTVVLCSDAYFLSNEAMRNDRSPGLIQWVMGTNPTLLFSEVHLGNGQKDRIMTLVRRYRLHGVLAGILLIGGLFIWKNGTTLLPRRERMLADQSVVDRSQGAGMNHLLSRFVAPAALLPLCVKEWRVHFGNSPAAPAVEKTLQSQENASLSTKDEATIVARYNQIAQEIQHRKP